MTNYLPYIFGLTSFLCGLYLFLLSFRLYKPKHKTDEQKERYKKWLEKFGTLTKVCSVVLVLNGSYDLLNPHSDRYRIGNKNARWTPEARSILIGTCLRDAGPKAEIYLAETKEYCECSVDKAMTAFSQAEYEKILKETNEEQMKKILPVFESCLIELRKKTTLADSLRKNGL